MCSFWCSCRSCFSLHAGVSVSVLPSDNAGTSGAGVGVSFSKSVLVGIAVHIDFGCNRRY